jgi:hypothetical protein
LRAVEKRGKGRRVDARREDEHNGRLLNLSNVIKWRAINAFNDNDS